jgi:hypothetical protein
MNARRARSLRVAGLALALAAVVVPAAKAQDEKFIPGYTDFPNALRTDGAPNMQRFTPGHTDFPNHLRVDSAYDRARAHGGSVGPVVVLRATEAGRFDWIDAGVGAGGAAALAALAAGAIALAFRRPVRGTTLTG